MTAEPAAAAATTTITAARLIGVLRENQSLQIIFNSLVFHFDAVVATLRTRTAIFNETLPLFTSPIPLACLVLCQTFTAE